MFQEQKLIKIIKGNGKSVWYVFGIQEKKKKNEKQEVKKYKYDVGKK